MDTEILFEEEIDIEDEISNHQIYTQLADPEIISIVDKINRGRLVLQPDFQRQYVWDVEKASRLIESALLDIPLPTIYLSEEVDGKTYVIDGQQRLTSFYSFVIGTLESSEVTGKLLEVEIYDNNTLLISKSESTYEFIYEEDISSLFTSLS